MVSRKNMSRTFDKYDVQDVAIEKFRQFATERNVHITLVVHPRKEAENERLSMASIYGSAKASQEADTVLILQTDGQKKWIEIKKNRFNGELGKCNLFFDRQSCRYQNEPLGPDAGGSSASPSSSPSRNVSYRTSQTPASPRSSDSSAKATNNANFWDSKFNSVIEPS